MANSADYMWPFADRFCALPGMAEFTAESVACWPKRAPFEQCSIIHSSRWCARRSSHAGAKTRYATAETRGSFLAPKQPETVFALVGGAHLSGHETRRGRVSLR